MATSKRDIKHGTMRTKVAGDDEMLRTGYHNGTPLEAGKVADAQPVDLFGPARLVADGTDDASQQQQMRSQEEEPQGKIIAESEPVDLSAGAQRVSEASGEDAAPAQGQGRQGMAAPAAGGRQ